MKKVFLYVAAMAMFAMGATSCNPGKDPDQNLFNIAIENITYQSADVTVTAADSSSYFYFDLVEATELAKVTNDSMANELIIYIQETMDFYKELGMELFYTDFLSLGKDVYAFDGLDEETEYVVLAFQIDTVAGKVSGKVETKNFTTTKFATTSNLSLTFSKDKGILTITPSKNGELFAFGFLLDEEIEYGYTFIDFVNEYASYGLDEYVTGKAKMEIDLFDYLYAGHYTVQAAAVKVTEVQEEYEGEVYTYNEYERIGNISSFVFDYTVADGAEEYTEDYAPARRKIAKAAAPARRHIVLKRGAK